MLAKTITWVDFDDVSHTKTYYFHLSKVDLIDLELRDNRGLDDYLKRIVAEEDNKAIFEIFKTIIKKSYGVKSSDGTRFIKSDELFEEFVQTPAYDQLIMELLGDADFAASFVNNIIPKDIVEQFGK